MTTADSERTGPTVYALGPRATPDDLDAGEWYLGEINGVVPYGVFVELNDQISGLVHESNLPRDYVVGEEIIVSLESIKPNGDIAFDAAELTAFEVIPFETEVDTQMISELTVDQDTVTIEGRIDQIDQTAGPTIFSLTDGERVIPCAAFEAAGVRAFPHVNCGDVVRLLGRPGMHEGGIQLEIDGLEVLSGPAGEERRMTIEDRLDAKATPQEISPLIEWDALDLLLPDLRELAKTLREAILESRPIRIRHHADGDGMCAAVPVKHALERFADHVHTDPTASKHLVSRAPSKAPYYEMEDATRDLNFALANRDRHGQSLPILLMLDNGSTKEDVPGYRNLAHYDIPIAVVDHHHPDKSAVESLLNHHINPYLVDEDYRITTGMLCVELARMIDPTLTPNVEHIPAVAGLSDRSAAEAMGDYLATARAAGFQESDIAKIGDALDYAAHWLQYRSGDTVVADILGIRDDGPHTAVVEHLAEEARDAMDAQLDVVLPHLESQDLPNGARLYQFDVDNHARRFQYPAPGKTTGAVHDAQVGDSGDPTITIGYGPDFCVLRSDGVRLDIPEIVGSLQHELPAAGVSGGGHLVVGSIKFVPGQRSAVLAAFIDHLGEAPLDHALTSARSPLEEHADHSSDSNVTQ